MARAYRIRVAVIADLERILALDRGIATVPHWGFADYVTALAPAIQDEDNGALKRCLLVAEIVPEIVGFAVGSLLELVAELESVGVVETERRLGIGRALCEAVIEWAHVNHADEIRLEVRSRSEGAIALYEALGFVAVGKRLMYYQAPGDDAVLMRLGLSS